MRYRHTKKYKNTKSQTCLEGLLPWDMYFQSSVEKYIPPLEELVSITAKIQTLEE